MVSFRLQVTLALAVGLIAAAIPVIVTSDRCDRGSAFEGRPLYLLFVEDKVADDLLCGAASDAVAFERVSSAAEVSARIQDEAVAGVVFDGPMYETVPGGAPGQWLAAGSGRALVGLQLTHWQMNLRMGGPPGSDADLLPQHRGELGYLRARPYVGVRDFKRTETRTCGREGTRPFVDGRSLGMQLRELARGC